MNPSELLKWFPLEPALYPSALALAVLLRFARAAFASFGFGRMYLVALGGGVVVSALTALKGEPWREVAQDGLMLSGATLLLEGGLHFVARRWGGLPRDNDWVRKRPRRRRRK